MERECCKCHCKFVSTKQDAEICPDCLRNEFATVAPSLNAEERAQLIAEYNDSMKRQAQRAEALGGAYSSGVAFSVAGKLRLALGLGIFLICGFLFLISDKDSNTTFLVGLDTDSQRLISLILCLVSAVLVATASVRYKMTVRILGSFRIYWQLRRKRLIRYPIPNLLRKLLSRHRSLQRNLRMRSALADFSEIRICRCFIRRNCRLSV